MKKTNATRETILNVNDFVEVVSEKGQSGLIGKSSLMIEGEAIEVYGIFSNDPNAIEACILFEGGEGDLTREALYPQLCDSFGLPNDGTWKYWQICGDFNAETNLGDVIDMFNEYPSGYWDTGKFFLATPEEMAAAAKRAEEERKRKEAELKEMGFTYSELYTTESWYKGRHDYHHSHGSSFRFNKPVKPSKYPFKVGIELEVIANDDAAYRKITELKSNWFFMERDGSLDSNGVEIITIPLRFEDASNPSFWKPFTAWLSKYAKSWTKSCCGLHVHIGNEVFNVDGKSVDELKARLSYAYNYCIDDTEFNKNIFGRAAGYSATKHKTKVGDAVATLGSLTKSTAKLIKDKDVQKALIEETNNTARNNRYYDINFSNSHTVEFRKGRGSINCERISTVVMYCYLMALWTRKAKWEDLLDLDDFKKFIVKNAPSEHPICRYVGDDESDM